MTPPSYLLEASVAGFGAGGCLPANEQALFASCLVLLYHMSQGYCPGDKQPAGLVRGEGPSRLTGRAARWWPRDVPKRRVSSPSRGGLAPRRGSGRGRGSSSTRCQERRAGVPHLARFPVVQRTCWKSQIQSTPPRPQAAQGCPKHRLRVDLGKKIMGKVPNQHQNHSAFLSASCLPKQALWGPRPRASSGRPEGKTKLYCGFTDSRTFSSPKRQNTRAALPAGFHGSDSDAPRQGTLRLLLDGPSAGPDPPPSGGDLKAS